MRDSVVLALGKIGDGRGSNQDSELKILVDSAQPISLEQARAYAKNHKTFENKLSQYGVNTNSARAAASAKPKIFIRLEDSSDQSQLLALKEKIDSFSGDTEVVLVTGPSDNKQIIKLPQTVAVNETSLRELADIFGSTNVVVK